MPQPARSVANSAATVDHGLLPLTELAWQASRRPLDGCAGCARISSRMQSRSPVRKHRKTCLRAHPVIDAVLALVEGRDQDEPVGRIVVDIFPEARKLPNEIAPKSLEGAQFSVPFAAALAAMRGAEAFRPLRPHSLSDAAVVALAGNVELRYPDEYAGIFPQRTPARVTMVVGGRERTVEVPRPLGDANNPMNQSAVEDKLHDLGRDLLSQAELEKLIQSVSLLRHGKIDPLLACLSAEPVKAPA